MLFPPILESITYLQIHYKDAYTIYKTFKKLHQKIDGRNIHIHTNNRHLITYT